jgi:hypothetical protein
MSAPRKSIAPDRKRKAKKTVPPRWGTWTTLSLFPDKSVKRLTQGGWETLADDVTAQTHAHPRPAPRLLQNVEGGSMRTLLVTTLAAISFVTTIGGQQAQDLSGTWVIDVSRSASAASGGHLPPEAQPPATEETLVIQQTPEELIIERRRGNTSEVLRYAFNKTEPLGTRPREPERTQQPVGTTGDPAPSPVGTAGVNDADPVAPRGANRATETAPVLGAEVQDARAEVKGDRILTKMVLNLNGKTVTTDESLYLAENGRELVVERLLKVHHGYEGPAKTDAVGKDVYIRSSSR